MKIVIGSDHAGFGLKEYIKKSLGKKIDFLDKGSFDESSVDYPDIAKDVALSILRGEAEYGVLVCGTGIGMCITANKFPGIYGAIVYSEETAKLAKKHNNANLLCLGGRTMEYDKAVLWIRKWLDEEFEGGRHLRRLNKIKDIEMGICGRKYK